MRLAVPVDRVQAIVAKLKKTGRDTGRAAASMRRTTIATECGPLADLFSWDGGYAVPDCNRMNAMIPSKKESMKLNGKVALVTGSTSGIGLGIARALAADGADIMLNGFGDEALIDKLVAELSSRYKVNVRHSAADMSKPGRDRGDGGAGNARAGRAWTSS